MKNTMKALATAAFLLTSTFASAQELTEEQKALLAKATAKATPEQFAALTFEQKVMIAQAQKLSDESKKEKPDAEKLKILKEKNDALIEKYIEEEKLSIEKGKKWSKVEPINPDALTGKPQGFATGVFNQEMTIDSKEVYSLRIDLTNEKVLDKFIIMNSKYRFPFDVKSIRMVFHKGGDAVSIPVRRGKSGPNHDKALIIDNPLAVERVFDLLEAQGSVKMELKMDYKFDTITRIVSFDTSNIPAEIIVDR